MLDCDIFLAGLNVYPSVHQIDEAYSYATEIAAGYVKKIDPHALVTVRDGDVDIYTNSDFEDLLFNAQCIFDAAFADMIEFALQDIILQEEMIADHGKFILTELSGDYLCDIYSCGVFYVVFYYQCENYGLTRSKCFSKLHLVFSFVNSLDNL